MTAAVLAAVIFFVLATLPPLPIPVDLSSASADVLRRTVAGAYHIHTTRSDGAEDKASIAAAAQRAGLQFAIFTDHGDATRTPDPPAYISGVLCLDGVEISTNGGHYVALDMPAAPYPLGGEAATVVEDVARLGGFGIAAHPDSPKAELAWSDWDAPVDGIEWVNVDSEWRDESRPALVRAALQYFIRPAPAVASVLDRPDVTLQRWAAAIQQRPVVALAAADAHGGMRQRLEGGLPAGVGPSYEATFRAFSNRVLLERPLSGDAAADGRLLFDAIRRGRVYTVVDSLATPGLYDFGSTASSLPLTPPGARVEKMGTAASWYQVTIDGAPGTPPVPWMVTNPVSFPAVAAPSEPRPDLEGGTPVGGEWRIEKDPRSTGRLFVTNDGTLAVSYQLASGARADQFVALVVDLRASTATRLIAFETQAAPMRLSVQLRFPDGDRWVKSVYVDVHRRPAVVAVADMVRAGGGQGAMPDARTATSLLFVVDLTNAVPGTAGTFHVSNVRFQQ